MQFNILLRDLCLDKRLYLIQHNDIQQSDLYDGIHLKAGGIRGFVRNLKLILNPMLKVRSPYKNYPTSTNYRVNERRDSLNSPNRYEVYKDKIITRGIIHDILVIYISKVNMLIIHKVEVIIHIIGEWARRKYTSC